MRGEDIDVAAENCYNTPMYSVPSSEEQRCGKEVQREADEVVRYSVVEYLSLFLTKRPISERTEHCGRL